MKLGDPGLYRDKKGGGFVLAWGEGNRWMSMGLVRDGEYCWLVRNSHSIIQANRLAGRGKEREYGGGWYVQEGAQSVWRWVVCAGEGHRLYGSGRYVQEGGTE